MHKVLVLLWISFMMFILIHSTSCLSPKKTKVCLHIFTYILCNVWVSIVSQENLHCGGVAILTGYREWSDSSLHMRQWRVNCHIIWNLINNTLEIMTHVSKNAQRILSLLASIKCKHDGRNNKHTYSVTHLICS